MYYLYLKYCNLFVSVLCPYMSGRKVFSLTIKIHNKWIPLTSVKRDVTLLVPLEGVNVPLALSSVRPVQEFVYVTNECPGQIVC